jgi:ectoine hydroxylase
MGAPPIQSIISDSQRQAYEADGYLALESFVTDPWLSELRETAAEFVERSRAETGSGKVFDLGPEHTAAAPRIRRLIGPVENHDTFARFTLEGPAAQLAQAVLGGPVRYHHSKLNFKWSGGGEEVQWHQDIQFWPHTDFSPLTIGVYLDDIDDEMGPMGVLPGSHTGVLYDQYDADGNWAGAMNPDDAAAVDLDAMVWLKGPAGSTTVHNCCMVHGSLPNNSDRVRPLLLQTYSRADSYPLMGMGANGAIGKLSGTIVGGESPQTVEIDGRLMVCAPDWSRKGAPTIFGSQQKDS